MNYLPFRSHRINQRLYKDERPATGYEPSYRNRASGFKFRANLGPVLDQNWLGPLGEEPTKVIL